jgi:hypothetical protein
LDEKYKEKYESLGNHFSRPPLTIVPTAHCRRQNVPTLARNRDIDQNFTIHQFYLCEISLTFAFLRWTPVWLQPVCFCDFSFFLEIFGNISLHSRIFYTHPAWKMFRIVRAIIFDWKYSKHRPLAGWSEKMIFLLFFQCYLQIIWYLVVKLLILLALTKFLIFGKVEYKVEMDLSVLAPQITNTVKSSNFTSSRSFFSMLWKWEFGMPTAFHYISK